MYKENGTATRNGEGYGDSACRSADLLSYNAQYLPHILRYRGEKIGKEERKEKHIRRRGKEEGEWKEEKEATSNKNFEF